MAVIDRETETALDAARDRYGRTVHHSAATAARARRTQAVLAAYATHLAEHGRQLLTAARSGLDHLPTAPHTTAWRDLLDVLAASHTEITRVINDPAAPGSAEQSEQRAAVWPHLAFWADYGSIAAGLADQHHQPGPELSPEDKRRWTDQVRAARRWGELDPIESWYAADGRLITVAYLVQDDTSTVIALAGAPDTAGWEVIGHYDHESAAGRALPRAVPLGVLRPEAASRFNRPAPTPERPVQELLQEVIEARTASEVSEALLTAARQGYEAGPLIRLERLLDTAARFSCALDTVRGQQIGARLAALGRQLAFLTQEVHDAAEDLGATVGVLPPYRTPAPPRIRPRPAVSTTPPTPPPQSTAATRRT
ncbi:hypothetical protein QR97_31885 [Streptomyces sp. PBH53]|uniref:hypothetical protein n=1 Tax=Streptomyces sp. PBH53 TaxID=1577075 RepID=UPI000655A456|nr:hypothetical protein [Streptomyces sp. PBH53]AKN73724.1 hypothetical protein QR97_31885 [Streptomyces sp. PBH53]